MSFPLIHIFGDCFTGVLWFCNDVCMNGLRELRLNLNLSQVGVARRGGIPLPTYKRVEKGEGLLTMRVAADIAQAFNIEVIKVYEVFI